MHSNYIYIYIYRCTYICISVSETKICAKKNVYFSHICAGMTFLNRIYLTEMAYVYSKTDSTKKKTYFIYE